MDEELIAIQRVRRAVKGLSEVAQMRVLQYVQQGMYEVHNEKQRAEQEAQRAAFASQGNPVSSMGQGTAQATQRAN